MIRNYFLNRYKDNKKSILDTEEDYLRQDDNFIVNKNRPLGDNQINKIPSNVLYSFVEDVLSNQTISSVLYAKNTKNEIQLYKKRNKAISRSVMSHPKERSGKSREVIRGSMQITKKRELSSNYIEIKEQIDNYRLNKSEQMSFMIQKNDIFFDDLQSKTKPDSIKSYYEPVNYIRIKSYKRAIQRCKSQLAKNPNFMLPDVKLNINNVYSRLYHNAVLLPKPKEDQKSLKMSSKKLNEDNDSNQKKKSLKFNLKQVINSSNGKNYTMKITDKIINRCMIKHSGGPVDNNKMRYDEIDIDEEKVQMKDPNLISLKDMKDSNGNSYLHEAVVNNSIEFVDYYLSKKLNPNQQNIQGNTPLHYAMKLNNKKIIKMLLDAKSDIFIRNANRETPFELAARDIKKMLKAEAMHNEKKKNLLLSHMLQD